MAIYYVDFSGYCAVNADSANEAEDKFWEYIYNNAPLPHNFYTFEGVEQASD